MFTNFSLLQSEQITAWSHDLWRTARNMSFIDKFLGKGPNSLIQHVTELKASEKGTRAIMSLLADLEGDGVAGDRTLEGNEEALKSFDTAIRVDQLRHANRLEGKMADQKSVINFRENSRDTLAYWLSDRVDQMAFLTLAGKSYAYTPNGVTRIGSDLQYLEFASDIRPPSPKRYGRWNAATKLIEWGVGSNAVTATDFVGWEMIVDAKAYCKDHYIRGLKEDGGEETYHVFLSPSAVKHLKNDPTYLLNLRHAASKGNNDKLFSGALAKIDGVYIHEYRHVPNTRLAPSGSKFGATGTVDGCQVLFCGAQALGMADIGNAEWHEKGFDYENQHGISTGKIMGFLKPQFVAQHDNGTKEDFGVLSIYAAQ